MEEKEKEENDNDEEGNEIEKDIQSNIENYNTNIELIYNEPLINIINEDEIYDKIILHNNQKNINIKNNIDITRNNKIYQNDKQITSLDNNLLKYNYKNFRNELTNSIKKLSISMKSEDCYLVEELKDVTLMDAFDNYDNFKNQLNMNNNVINGLDKKNVIVFINDFSSIINCIKNNKKLKLVPKQLIKTLYEENSLKQCNSVKYYTGNNKLIIEYNDNKYNNALLLINPLEENENNKKIFLISLNNKDKYTLFKELLNNNDNLNQELNNNNIISIEKYLNILKLLIYIYYYEKNLLKNKEEEDCYLINCELIKKYKEYYDYSQLYESLNNIKESLEIKDNNFDEYFNNIIENKNIINFDKIKIYNNTINIEEIKPQIKNMMITLIIVLIAI